MVQLFSPHFVTYTSIPHNKKWTFIKQRIKLMGHSYGRCILTLILMSSHHSLSPPPPLTLTCKDHAEYFTQSPCTAVGAPAPRANMLP